MNKKITNVCNITMELYVEYYKKHVFKHYKKITLFCIIVSLANLIPLIILRINGQENLKAIAIVTAGLIITLFMQIIPICLGIIEYNKRESLGKEYLINKYVFNENSFEINSGNITTLEYYNNIKKIDTYENFSVISMKNKKYNYIIDNKFENGNIANLSQLIKGGIS